jgi:hypothetical protein
MHGRSRSRSRTRPARGTRAATSAPTPPLTNLLAWYKADAGVTKDGSDFVSAWADQSGNGYTLTQATGAKQPKWLASQRGSMPAIDFDGSDDILANGALGALLAGSDKPVYIYVVGYPDALVSARTLAALCSTVNNNPLHWCQGASSGALVYQRRDDAAASATPSLVAGFAASAWQVWGFEFAGTQGRTRQNANAGGLMAADVGTASFNNFSVGALGRATESAWYDGRLGEILVYSADPTYANVTSYLNDAARWNSVF